MERSGGWRNGPLTRSVETSMKRHVERKHWTHNDPWNKESRLDVCEIRIFVVVPDECK